MTRLGTGEFRSDFASLICSEDLSILVLWRSEGRKRERARERERERERERGREREGEGGQREQRDRE